MSRHQDSFDRNIARARQQLIEQLTQLSKSFIVLLQDPAGAWRRGGDGDAVRQMSSGARMKNTAASRDPGECLLSVQE
jgi:hypothetical protein